MFCCCYKVEHVEDLTEELSPTTASFPDVIADRDARQHDPPLPPPPQATLSNGWRTDKAGGLDQSPGKAEEDLKAIGATVCRSDELYTNNDFACYYGAPMLLTELKLDRKKQCLPTMQLMFMQSIVQVGNCFGHPTTFEFSEGRVREVNLLSMCVKPPKMDHVVGGFISANQSVDVCMSNGAPFGCDMRQYQSLTLVKEESNESKAVLAGYSKARGHYIAVFERRSAPES